MKIGLIAPPYIPVPPIKYGGTERILGYLATGMVENGLDITLFASGDSKLSVPLKPIVDTALFLNPNYDHSIHRDDSLSSINLQTINGIKDLKLDLINTHDYENIDLIKRLTQLGIPVLVTIRHAKTPIIEEVFSRFKSLPNLYFQGLTKKQNEDLDPSLPFIHNGIDETKYVFTRFDLKNFVLSLGDTKPIKGHSTAIDLVKRTNLGMLIAGSYSHHHSSREYFEQELKSNIDLDVSGQQTFFLEDLLNDRFTFKKGQIVYFGEVDDKTKQTLFNLTQFTQFLGNLEVQGNIDACPGVVLESIMTGTPVLGVKNSVTQELVFDGVTGYNVHSLDEALKKINLISKLSRESIRNVGINMFSSKKMVLKYIELYKQILERK